MLHVTFFGRIDCESSPCQERFANPGRPTCAEAPQGAARRGPSSHPDLGSGCSLEAFRRAGPPAIARGRQQPYDKDDQAFIDSISDWNAT
jgi:hypothetical protein